MKPASIAAAALIVAALAAVSMAQPEEEQPNRRVQAQVDRLMQNDQNGDGKLTRDELPARLADRIFDAADADGDGELTRAELETHMANPRGPGGPGGARPAAPAAPATPAAPAVRNDHDAFEGAMKQAGGAMRTLRRTEFAPETQASDLDAVQSIQEAMVLAKTTFRGITPSEQAAAKYAGDAEAYNRDFRLALIDTLRAALDLEEAILKGDAEAAKAAHGRVMASQKAAHDLFQNE